MRLSLLFSLALAACGLVAHPAAAQTAPLNDQCQNASLLVNGQPTYGTTVGAADDVPGLVGCQTGTGTTSYPEVWYAFVATAPTLNYQLSNMGANDSLALHLFSGSCGNLTLQGSTCGGDTISGSQNGLTLGDTYYLAVTNTGSSGFLLQVQLTNAVVFPAQDCNQAVVLANLTTIQQGPLNMGPGLALNEVSPQNSCWGSAGERQPKWYRFTAGTTGKLEFNINPDDPNTDYDWAVWDVTNDPLGCTTKGSALACNWSGARGATGLSSCPTLEPGYQGADQFDNTTTGQTGANGPITVQAGRVYALLVDNFTTNSTGYTLTFGGACPVLPTGPRPAVLGLEATFTTTMQPGLTVDFRPEVTVDPALTVSYHWSFGDGATSTLAQPTHTYAAPGTYYTTLRVTDMLGSVVSYGRPLTAGVTGRAEEAARAARLSLVPNPARQSVRLTLAEGLAAGTAVQLYNTLGGLVRTLPLTAQETTATLDLTGLAPGVYSVRVGSEIRRLVISE